MATITLKNVPEELHVRLFEQAKAHKRSLNKEAIRCLESELFPKPVDPEAFLEKIRTSRIRLQEAGVQELDDAFLRRAETDGRE